MKTNKKTKTEENEYWVDELLEQPQNHRVEPDGSILYGYWEEIKLFSQGWWLDKKNALVHVWSAKNPFNENRKVMKACLPLTHPNAYRIFFPFSYYRDAIVSKCFFKTTFLGELIIEMLVLIGLGIIVCGAAIIFCKLTGIGLA